MKILKKNQVVIFVIALLLVTAGYLSYNKQNLNNNTVYVSTTFDNNTSLADLGDAEFVSSKNVISNETMANILENNTDTKIETKEENETNTTNSEISNDYFTNSKLDRDSMYSQMIESYQKVLQNTNVSEEQKSISSKEISKINETKNAIMIAENLIKTKGMEDLVIFVNDDSINVIVKAEKLTTEQIAQIQNIITRELNTKIENIHISNK